MLIFDRYEPAYVRAALEALRALRDKGPQCPMNGICRNLAELLIGEPDHTSNLGYTLASSIFANMGLPTDPLNYFALGPARPWEDEEGVKRRKLLDDMITFLEAYV